MENARTQATTWTATAAEAASLRSAFERELAAEQDLRRRREMSEALALGMARVQAERGGDRLSEDLAARHVVAEQMVLAPWRRAQGLGDAAELAVFGEPLHDDLETFLSAVGLPARHVA